MTTEYMGSVYVGVVGSENENGRCRDSIDHLRMQPGDTGPVFIRATKGFEARQMHIDQFLKNTVNNFIFLMDSDQVFPIDALDKLRAHKLPFISGYYLRRQYNPIAPVWYRRGEAGVMPMQPWTADPERGALVPLGASGWGCVLIHRDVFTGVEKLLKGESFVIEDDMDIYPYDLRRTMRTIDALEAISRSKPTVKVLWPSLAEYVGVLREEIKPLRWTKDNVGSDIRFPFFARLAGFELWGDPDVRCDHTLNYPLSCDDYSGIVQEARDQLEKSVQEMTALELELRRKYIEE